MELARGSGCYQNMLPQDSFVKLFQQESRQKIEALQNDSTFQTILDELQNSGSKEGTATLSGQNQKINGELYIFVSFSMGEKALLNLAHEAKSYGATLVLRGFKDGSYTKTAKALQKIITRAGQGVVIDPELYSLFQITAVPTFVLAKPLALQVQERAQIPIHDKLQGHVSVQHALEQFAKEGDLKDEVQALLKNIPLKSGGLP
jgi:type-F conjugative transfer system pilin assembly protein TrbC